MRIHTYFQGIGCAFTLFLLACGDSSTAAGGSGPTAGAAEGGSPSIGGAGGGEAGAPPQGGAGGEAEGGGGSAPILPNCEPATSGEISETCGVFVQPGAEAGDGSQAAPYGSLAAAVAAVGPATFYVCGNGIVESVTVGAGDSVFGGLDCSWSWGSAELVWTANEGEVPLKIAGNGSASVVKLVGLAIEAPNPSAIGPIEKRSSVGIIAESATVELERVTVQAAAGLDGLKGINGVTPADAGNGTIGILLNTGSGPVGGTSPCGRTGGHGGSILNFGLITFQGGGDGVLVGAGGDGISVVDGEDPDCQGDNGANVSNAADASDAMGLGQLTSAGFVGTNGADGAVGPHGNGGGGGGARNLSYVNNVTGSAGGGGGCGGTGGVGGAAGGASIAIISIQSSWTFTDVSLEVAGGGDGGDGGLGAQGSEAGIGVIPGFWTAAEYPCKGGNGSAGGDGGDAGGGTGGHAILIAYTGATPDLTSVTTVMPTQAGSGGDAASDGVAALMQQFP